jgi:hypothetical protein
VECLEGASEVLVEVLTDNNQEDTQNKRALRNRTSECIQDMGTSSQVG